jgi:hypothetical protein
MLSRQLVERCQEVSEKEPQAREAGGAALPSFEPPGESSAKRADSVFEDLHQRRARLSRRGDLTTNINALSGSRPRRHKTEYREIRRSA